jgi:hypothetical protein
VAHAEHERAVADFGASAQPLGQLHVLLRRAHEVVDGGHGHEGEADGKQHLVEVRLAVHGPVERAFQQGPGQSDDDEGERQAGQERQAELLHREHREVSAGHGEGTVREVDEVHQPERHGESDCQHEEQHAVGDAVEKNGQHVSFFRSLLQGPVFSGALLGWRALVFGTGATNTGCSPPRMSPASLLLYFAAGSTRYSSHLARC